MLHQSYAAYMQNVDACSMQGALGSQGQDGRWTPSDRYADIRVDEDYERFYRAQAASGKKLPPPLDSNTLYDRGSNLSAQAQAALAARLQGVNGMNGTAAVPSHST